MPLEGKFPVLFEVLTGLTTVSLQVQVLWLCGVQRFLHGGHSAVLSSSHSGWEDCGHQAGNTQRGMIDLKSLDVPNVYCKAIKVSWVSNFTMFAITVDSEILYPQIVGH
jgi:hypothetical protein